MLTESRIFELIDLALDMLKDLLPDHLYVDDIAEGPNCFRLSIWRDGAMTPCQTFTFCYDAEDVFDRTDIEQLIDELNYYFSF